MENTFKHIDHIEELIYRFLTRHATPFEVRELRNWIKANPENTVDFKKFHAIWFLVQRSGRLTTYDQYQAWDELKKEILAENTSSILVPLHRFRMLSNFRKIAAVFIFAFASGFCAVYVFKSPEQAAVQSYTEQKVPRGSKTFIILPDSSTVWLNSGSTLRYSTAFNDAGREVFLEGEAYFDVKKKDKKPFFVRTQGVTVKVLGTAFNVRAYPNERLETTVQRGLVQVQTNDPKDKMHTKILLHPNQQAIFEIEKKKTQIQHIAIKTTTNERLTVKELEVKLAPAVVEEVDAVVAASWKDKRWIISHEDLQSLAVKIGRRFDVEVVFADVSLYDYHFSGILEDETLEQVLNLIKLSAPIQFTVKQKTVTLYEKK